MVEVVWVEGAIGNGFGGDNGCRLLAAGTTSVVDDNCSGIVAAGYFNNNMWS